MSDDWLNKLSWGADGICELEVVIVLHRHRMTLLNADQIAQLLSYHPREVIAALDRLEGLSIVERSRLLPGALWYKLARQQGPGGTKLNELLYLAETRAGRIDIIKRLRRMHRMEVSAVVLLEKRLLRGFSCIAEAVAGSDVPRAIDPPRV